MVLRGGWVSARNNKRCNIKRIWLLHTSTKGTKGVTSSGYGYLTRLLVTIKGVASSGYGYLTRTIKGVTSSGYGYLTRLLGLIRIASAILKALVLALIGILGLTRIAFAFANTKRILASIGASINRYSQKKKKETLHCNQGRLLLTVA